MEESEAEQEIETLKAIWPELQDRPPVWNSPSVAIPVYPLGAAGIKGVVFCTTFAFLVLLEHDASVHCPGTALLGYRATQSYSCSQFSHSDGLRMFPPELVDDQEVGRKVEMCPRFFFKHTGTPRKL